ncbi:Na-translocating system protein MpsC family protein, partial [Neobacillus drentensis]
VLSYLLNERTLVVIRNGILVPIEKELIRLGNFEALRLAKRNLEKRLLHNSGNFESILQTKVNDIFVDWDFYRDKSVIVLILSPTA